MAGRRTVLLLGAILVLWQVGTVVVPFSASSGQCSAAVAAVFDRVPRTVLGPPPDQFWAAMMQEQHQFVGEHVGGGPTGCALAAGRKLERATALLGVIVVGTVICILLTPKPQETAAPS